MFAFSTDHPLSRLSADGVRVRVNAPCRLSDMKEFDFSALIAEDQALIRCAMPHMFHCRLHGCRENPEALHCMGFCLYSRRLFWIESILPIIIIFHRTERVDRIGCQNMPSVPQTVLFIAIHVYFILGDVL